MEEAQSFDARGQDWVSHIVPISHQAMGKQVTHDLSLFYRHGVNEEFCSGPLGMRWSVQLHLNLDIAIFLTPGIVDRILLAPGSRVYR